MPSIAFILPRSLSISLLKYLFDEMIVFPFRENPISSKPPEHNAVPPCHCEVDCQWIRDSVRLVSGHSLATWLPQGWKGFCIIDLWTFCFVDIIPWWLSPLTRSAWVTTIRRPITQTRRPLPQFRVAWNVASVSVRLVPQSNIPPLKHNCLAFSLDYLSPTGNVFLSRRLPDVHIMSGSRCM